jgi:hypothetical protein
MKLRFRCAWLCPILLMFSFFGFDGMSVKAFANDVVLISTTILPAGQTGIPYSAPVVAGDGAAPFRWYLTSGNLPSGLALNSQTGIISGTPGGAGTFTFTAGITDREGFSDTAKLSILITSVANAVKPPTYGAGVGADGLCNTTIGGPYEHKASYRFRAMHTGAIERAMIYLIPDKSGYAGGTGGTIQVTIRTDDGSAAHNPSNTTLATYYISHAASLPSPQRYFYVIKFATPPTLTAGNIYHMVFQNVDSQAQNNFISVDSLYQSSVESSMPPAPSDPEAAVLMSVEGGPWAPRPGLSPIYEFDFQDGASQGIGYEEAWVTDHQNISGTSPLRERFTLTGSEIKVTSAAIRLSRINGNDPLVIRFENANGTLIEEGRVAASSIPLSSASSPKDAWAIYTFSSPHTLVPGQTYDLVFECSATSTYQAFPVQKGAYYGFQSTTFFPDGHAEVKINNSWTGWSQWGTANRTDDDLQFYLSVAH